MKTILGIDYGRKRVGLSIYHHDIDMVLPLPAIVSNDDNIKISKIATIVCHERVKTIVVGYPFNMNGTIGPQARHVDKFIQSLEQSLPDINIVRSDERLTSEEATKTLNSDICHRSAVRTIRRRKSGVIDSQSAVIILQDFLNTISHD